MFSSSKSFDTTFEFDPKGMKISPGVSARVEIRGTNLKDALSVPRQALFTTEGKPVVYLKHKVGGLELLNDLAMECQTILAGKKY